MATYKGHEVPPLEGTEPDPGKPLPGMLNVEEELDLPEEAGPDYVPRPGQKGYMETKPMADDKVKDSEVRSVTPRNMRPRSTPNAEINAQERDKVLRDMGAGYPLAPNQSYSQGGSVKHGSSTCVECHYSDGRKYR